MIDAKELRIGNWIKYKETHNAKITLSDFAEMSNNEEYFMSLIEPIVITEKWLLKFGFVNTIP